MIVSAILLHLGIYIFMMIYDFQLVFIAVQGFFIENTTYKNFAYKIKQKSLLLWKKK